MMNLSNVLTVMIQPGPVRGFYKSIQVWQWHGFLFDFCFVASITWAGDFAGWRFCAVSHKECRVSTFTPEIHDETWARIRPLRRINESRELLPVRWFQTCFFFLPPPLNNPIDNYRLYFLSGGSTPKKSGCWLQRTRCRTCWRRRDRGAGPTWARCEESAKQQQQEGSFHDGTKENTGVEHGFSKQTYEAGNNQRLNSTQTAESHYWNKPGCWVYSMLKCAATAVRSCNFQDGHQSSEDSTCYYPSWIQKEVLRDQITHKMFLVRN